jgi:hypothetical protein
LSIQNETDEYPTLELIEAEIVMVPETVAPLAGESMVAVVEPCAKGAASKIVDEQSAIQNRLHESGTPTGSLTSMRIPQLLLGNSCWVGELDSAVGCLTNL